MQNTKEFRIEKGIENKGDKLSVKWKSYDNSFKSWIDKKDILKWNDLFSKTIYIPVVKKSKSWKSDLKKATAVDTTNLLEMVMWN